MNGDDPAGKDLPFGNEPIDRSSVAPRPDLPEVRRIDDDIEELPFEATDDSARNGSSADARKDQFAPPDEPCECYCLHCQRTFMSDQMWFQRVIGDPKGFEGF